MANGTGAKFCFSAHSKFATFGLLNLSPFILRELSKALRQDQGRWRRFWVVLAAVAACFGGAVLAGDFNRMGVGRLVLGALLGWAWMLAYWAGVAHAPNLFAEDRRSGMLSLVFLTGVRAPELFCAKIGGVLLVAGAKAVGMAPCFFMPMLMLRLPADFFLMVLALLAAWLFLCVAINVLASVALEDQSSARIAADLGLLVIVAVPLGIDAVSKMFGGTMIDPAWLTISPARGPWLLVAEPRWTSWETVGLCAGSSALLALVMLATASAILSGSWRVEVEGAAAAGRFERAIQPLRRVQARRAKNLLEISPYGWLIARDYRPVLAAWMAMALVLGVWAVGMWHWPKFWVTPLNMWITCVLLSELARFLIDYLAAKQVGADRSSGGLEIVLTTGASIEEVLGGLEHVVRRFGRPLYAVVALVMAGFFLAGFFARNWTKEALVTYLGVWSMVVFFGPWTGRGYYTAFWVSLHTGRPGFALRKRLLQYGGVIAGVVQLVINYKTLIKFPFGTNWEYILVLGIGAFLLVILPFGFRQDRKQVRKLRQMIFDQMRHVASEPIPPPDSPALKSWNPAEPFYRPRLEKFMV